MSGGEMNITDKVGKITNHEFQLDNDYEIRDLVAVQFEGEVWDIKDRPIGEEDEIKRTVRIRPKAVEIRKITDGIYSEPSSSVGSKSRSKRLRSSLYVYWEQQLQHKMTFEAFYDSWMNKTINKVREQLQ